MNKKAIVLLSGGLDSATTLFFAKKKGYQCFALSFDYGQRHNKELKAAKRISAKSKVGLQTIKVRFPHRASSLLDKKKKLPQREEAAIMRKGIPSTYVPARNTVFLSYALSLAEAIHAETIFIGANALDYSGYPDCRSEYYEAFNKLIRAGLRDKRIKILTPLIKKSKAEIVTMALRLGVPLELTWSCYKGAKKPCGHCDSCILRAKGFKQAGLEDPLLK